MIVSDTPRIELLHGDCMDYMATLPDNAFELAIVDPPYGIGVASVGKMTSVSRKKYAIKSWDENVPTKEYFYELKRVSHNQIIWGSNFFDGVGLIGGGIVWNKLGTSIGRRAPMPNLSDCEIAYCSMRTNVKMFSYTQIGNVYGNDYQVDWAQNRIHPTQKPVALYRWLLHNYAKQGDRILDTHLGSGSSAIACHGMGFDMVGIELDADYYTASVKRFKQQTAQLAIL
jgi:site-specific DNA-methyltransferase (adenine-specific)